jgi:hypothetical protein
MNFLGYSGFNGFVGVVEDINDPLKSGRVKVRFFGFHSDNLEEMPTERLPWAQIGIAANGLSTPTTNIKAGDWVLGRFLDGEARQAPIVETVIRGIKPVLENIGKGFSNQSTLPYKVVPPEGIIITNPGEPSIPRLARGNTVGATLEKNNSQHSCDFKFNIKFGDLSIGLVDNPVAVIKKAIQEGKNAAAKIIRSLLAQFADGIKVILTALNFTLSLDPSGLYSAAFDLARSIIRKINKILKKVAEYVAVAAMYVYLVKELQQVVAFIKQLPSFFKKLLLDCLNTFQNNIRSLVAQINTIVKNLNQSIQSIQKNITSLTSGLANYTTQSSPTYAPEKQISADTINKLKNENLVVDYTDTADLDTIRQALLALDETTQIAITDIQVSANTNPDTQAPDYVDPAIISKYINGYTYTYKVDDVYLPTSASSYTDAAPNLDDLKNYLQTKYSNTANNFMATLPYKPNDIKAIFP